MLASMSASELIEWQAYFSIVPFTQDREDMRTGIIASTIVNMLRSSKGKVANPMDFVTKWRKPNRKADNVLKIASQVNALRIALGKQDSP